MYFKCFTTEVNMPYVTVTLDVGAVINGSTRKFKLLLKYLQQLSNVIIHVGDFHIMKEDFKIVRLFGIQRNSPYIR